MLTLMEFVFLEIFGTHPLQVFESFFFRSYLVPAVIFWLNRNCLKGFIA